MVLFEQLYVFDFRLKNENPQREQQQQAHTETVGTWMRTKNTDRNSEKMASTNNKRKISTNEPTKPNDKSSADCKHSTRNFNPLFSSQTFFLLFNFENI
jgi:hypothetical protein